MTEPIIWHDYNQLPHNPRSQHKCLRCVQESTSGAQPETVRQVFATEIGLVSADVATTTGRQPAESTASEYERGRRDGLEQAAHHFPYWNGKAKYPENCITCGLVRGEHACGKEFNCVRHWCEHIRNLAMTSGTPAPLSSKAIQRLEADMKMDEIKRPLMREIDGIPRRCRIDLATPTESAIRDARQMVEAMPADVRLTDATILLGKAIDKVADYLEDIAAPPPADETLPAGAPREENYAVIEHEVWTCGPAQPSGAQDERLAEAAGNLAWAAEVQLQAGHESRSFKSQHRAKVEYWIKQVRAVLAATREPAAPPPFEILTEAKELLRDCVLPLRVLYAIGKSRSTKPLGKVEIPSWGAPIMERCEELLGQIELFLVADVKVIQSAAPASGTEGRDK